MHTLTHTSHTPQPSARPTDNRWDMPSDMLTLHTTSFHRLMRAGRGLDYGWRTVLKQTSWPLCGN